ALTQRSVQMLTFNFNPDRFTAAVISLDAVVFSDGRVVGPDLYDVVGLEAAMAAADEEVLAQLSNPTLSDADLSEWLAVLVAEREQKAPTDPATGNAAMVRIHRSSQAKLVSRQVATLGRASTAQWFQGAIAHPKTEAPYLLNLHHVP